MKDAQNGLKIGNRVHYKQEGMNGKTCEGEGYIYTFAELGCGVMWAWITEKKMDLEEMKMIKVADIRKIEE